MRRLVQSWWLVLPLLSACAVTNEPPFAQFSVSESAGIAGIVPQQARVRFAIVRDRPLGLRPQAIAGLTISTASVTLTNANPGILAMPLTKNLSLDGHNMASSVFSALRPAGGYALSVALRDANNVPIGSGVAEGLAFPAGVTSTVTIVIGQDNQVAISASSVGNDFGTAGAYVISRGDTLLLKTGFAGTETAVSSWSVILSSSLYRGSGAIASFPGSTDFSSIIWATGTANNSGGWHYDPNLLTVTGTPSGTIKFELYDATNKVIGRSTLSNVSILDGAGLNVQLQ